MPLLERKLDAITDSVVNQTAGMGVSSRTFAQAAMGAAANAARSVPQVGGSTIAASTSGSASSPAVTALEVAFRRAMEGMTMNARFDNIDRLATYTTARVVLAAERL